MSSHEQYDLLTIEVGNIEVLEGFGQLMREIGKAMHQYADSLLTGTKYKHPISLEWTLSAVQSMMEGERGSPHYQTLSLLMRNLSGLEKNLREEETLSANIDVTVFNSRRTKNTSLKSLLSPKHPRFKSAVRLTLAWLLGYAIIQVFSIDKGAWILLTSAWKGMRLEPKYSRQYEESAFNLTNLNHALLSYISAFGVHKHAESLTVDEREFCIDVSVVLQYVTDLLNNRADESRLNLIVEKANCWEDRFDELQEDSSNRRVGLIYNIAHVSRQLLLETKYLSFRI